MLVKELLISYSGIDGGASLMTALVADIAMFSIKLLPSLQKVESAINNYYRRCRELCRRRLEQHQKRLLP